MQVELDRCIATTQQILADLGGPLIDFGLPDAQASAIISPIATSGIQRIEDSRVPCALSAKLHELAESYFRKACLALTETRSTADASTLRSIALQLKSTYTGIYERQVLAAASARRTPRTTEKQPYANDVLLYAFQRSQTPSRRERERLATLTGMTVEQVRVWFQNRRSRQKKKAPEAPCRPGLQLSELLERVAVSKKTAVESKQPQEDQYEDSYDSGYCSGSERPHTHHTPSISALQQNSASLFSPSPSARSYPAIYVPQPLTTQFDFDSPQCIRAPVHSPCRASTVTVDELARCMARLTLRQRRAYPSDSISVQPVSVTDHPMVSAPASVAGASKKKPMRKDADTGRKLAGARRASSSPVPPPASTVVPASVLPSSLPPSIAALAFEAESKPRKKSGPPRRKAPRILSRQMSGGSLSSTSTSSSSSRSTSYGSDCSLSSSSSATSVSSADSLSTLHSSGCLQDAATGQQAFDPSNLLASYISPTNVLDAQVPVYDLSTWTCDFTDMVDVPALYDDTEMLQILHGAQSLQEQASLSHPRAAPALLTSASHSSSSAGLTDMGAVLEFSGLPFPNIESVLSHDLRDDSSFTLQSQTVAPMAVPFPGAPQQGGIWRDIAVLISGQA